MPPIKDKTVNRTIALNRGWTIISEPIGSDLFPYAKNPDGRYLGGGTKDVMPDYINNREHLYDALKGLNDDLWENFKNYLHEILMGEVDYETANEDRKMFLFHNASTQKQALALYFAIIE